MLILADNDVTGAVAVLRRILESDDWREYAELLDVRFLSFEDLGLPRSAPDRDVWLACQQAGALLITANRAGGAGPLGETIESLATSEDLPVLTLADPQRIMKDGRYSVEVVIQLLDYLDQIDDLRGARRLFLP
jgi:hypothetical protein